MAKFGAKYPCFKPTGATAGFVMGKLVGADLTTTLASGELWADDMLTEQLSQFASGSIALVTDELTEENAAKIYGATASEDGDSVVYKVDDTPPEGVFAFYTPMMKGGVKYFRGYSYPRAKGALGNETNQTRGSSITFQTENTTLTVMGDSNGKWREVKRFDTEAEAITWVNTQVGISTGG